MFRCHYRRRTRTPVAMHPVSVSAATVSRVSRGANHRWRRGRQARRQGCHAERTVRWARTACGDGGRGMHRTMPMARSARTPSGRPRRHPGRPGLPYRTPSGPGGRSDDRSDDRSSGLIDAGHVHGRHQSSSDCSGMPRLSSARISRSVLSRACSSRADSSASLT